MIGKDDFQRLLVDNTELTPPTDRADATKWWAERGVDFDSLVAFCSEDAIDTLENVWPTVVRAADLSVVIASSLAMSTEVGFIFGFILGRQELEEHNEDSQTGKDTP